MAELHRKNILFLKQVVRDQVQGEVKLLTSRDLELDGIYVAEWNCFVEKLYQEGITLKNSADSLVWHYNRKSGSVNANLAYKLILEDGAVDNSSWWTRFIWGGNFPLKITCFVWLCLHNKILTWDTL